MQQNLKVLKVTDEKSRIRSPNHKSEVRIHRSAKCHGSGTPAFKQILRINKECNNVDQNVAQSSRK